VPQDHDNLVTSEARRQALRFRDELLNDNWFVELEEAIEGAEAWRIDYNEVRPHTSLGYKTPKWA